MAVWRRKLESFGVERAVELLRDHPVGVSSLSWGGGFTGTNGMTFEEALEDTRAAIRQAASIGAHALTVVSGPRGGHIDSHARRLLLDGLAASLDLAAYHGVTLALQPMADCYADEWTFLDTFEETLEIVRDFNHPYLGIACGTCHVWQEPSLLEQLREAARIIATVQLSDCRNPLTEFDRLLPGEGVVPLNDIVRTLLAAGFQGDFEIDVWSSELWGTDPEQLINRCLTACRPLLTSTSPPAPLQSIG